MSANSFVKYANGRKPNADTKLYWSRAGEDGAPFRGAEPPTLTGPEYDNRVARVFDAKNRTFDTSNPADNKAYLDVIDKISNGWYQLIHRHHEPVVIKDEKDGVTTVKLKVLVYIEWLETYMEDGKPDR